jgi:VWFA-related protein
MRSFAAILAVLALQTPSQEVRIRSGVYTPQPPTIAVQSNLVELGATVKDSHGKFASGLQVSDFEVLDNRIPQAIQGFSEQRTANGPDATHNAAPGGSASAAANAPRPRSLALFFDDTHPEPYGLMKAKEAAKKLISTDLQPDDRMGIFTGSGTVTLDFTSDPKVVLEALARVQQHPHLGAFGLGECPRLDPFQAYVIANHLDVTTKQAAVAEVCACLGTKEACTAAPVHVQDMADVLWNEFKHDSSDVLDVLEVVVRHLAAAPGNRILVIVSPGFGTLGMENRTSAIVEAALRSHIVINSLDSMGLVASRQSATRQVLLSGLMSDVSAATGGQFIENSNDFVGNLHKLAGPPDVSYLMAFSPAKDPDGNYHELNVRLKNHPGFHIQSRPGYFATILAKPPETIQQRIDREVLSAETREELPATVHVSSANTASGLITIDVNVNVDANRLKFVAQDDRQVQQLTFVTVLEDGEGHLIAGKQAVMDLSLLPATLADMQAKGIKAGMTLTAPKGSYHVREIIREVVEDHMTISNIRVAVP